MVEYLTREALRRRAGPISDRRGRVVLAEQRSPAGTTFLSHSSMDVDVLPKVVAILERHGATVYIDKKDELLPPTTSRETASMLRDRIKQSHKFVLLTTKASKDSRWVPWELGLADGFKNSRKTVIFPTVETAGDVSWTEREYLGIYDRIVYGRCRVRRAKFSWSTIRKRTLPLNCLVGSGTRRLAPVLA